MSRARRKIIKLMSALVVIVGLMALSTLIVKTHKLESRFDLFINDLDEVTDELVKGINDNPTLDGIVQARLILNTRKAGLKQKLDALKTVKATQVSAQTLTQFHQSIEGNGKKIYDLFIHHPALLKAEKDPQFKEQMEKLIDDYKSIIR